LNFTANETNVKYYKNIIFRFRAFPRNIFKKNFRIAFLCITIGKPNRIYFVPGVFSIAADKAETRIPEVTIMQTIYLAHVLLKYSRDVIAELEQVATPKLNKIPLAAKTLNCAKHYVLTNAYQTHDIKQHSTVWSRTRDVFWPTNLCFPLVFFERFLSTWLELANSEDVCNSLHVTFPFRIGKNAEKTKHMKLKNGVLENHLRLTH